MHTWRNAIIAARTWAGAGFDTTWFDGIDVVVHDFGVLHPLGDCADYSPVQLRAGDIDPDTLCDTCTPEVPIPAAVTNWCDAIDAAARLHQALQEPSRYTTICHLVADAHVTLSQAPQARAAIRPALEAGAAVLDACDERDRDLSRRRAACSNVGDTSNAGSLYGYDTVRKLWCDWQELVACGTDPAAASQRVADTAPGVIGSYEDRDAGAQIDRTPLDEVDVPDATTIGELRQSAWVQLCQIATSNLLASWTRTVTGRLERPARLVGVVVRGWAHASDTERELVAPWPHRYVMRGPGSVDVVAVVDEVVADALGHDWSQRHDTISKVVAAAAPPRVGVDNCGEVLEVAAALAADATGDDTRLWEAVWALAEKRS